MSSTKISFNEEEPQVRTMSPQRYDTSSCIDSDDDMSAAGGYAATDNSKEMISLENFKGILHKHAMDSSCHDQLGSNTNHTGTTSKRISSKILSLVGNPSTFKRTAGERREKRKQMTYEPTHRWWEPPIWAWLPQCNREILVILFVYNVFVTTMARYSKMCGDPEHHDPGHIFCSDEWILMEDKALVGFAVGMFLLLAFRANQAYDRWWEGRKVWGRTREVCRDFSRLVCNHVDCHTASDKADRRRAINFLTAFACALKLHLRDERHIVLDLTLQGTTVGDRLKGLSLQDIANIQQADHMPNFCMDIISDYLAKQTKAGKLSDYQLGTLNETVMAVLSDKLGSCERIRNTPIPLSYVLQLRFFLILWLALYPLHVVAFYGWYTILLASLVSYAVLGIESMASEIENPFGYDRNDLDLDKFCQGICKDTQDILDRHESQDRHLLFDRKHIDLLNKSQQFHAPTAAEAAYMQGETNNRGGVQVFDADAPGDDSLPSSTSTTNSK
ncbi:UPF0187 protein YneE [Seminavis robusta]|uniref:UPF0187 protein YneE n=1 Tax=Seminavis robusta TaxID=568900 RepID=A0A9N8E5Z9_9STRA|nr:UPF0187 protein YneE [Seminavis robusta]|eukprot:Sro697_g189060.1 UPF0187 protein YneE (502) ;mRNA; r:25012-26517